MRRTGINRKILIMLISSAEAVLFFAGVVFAEEAESHDEDIPGFVFDGTKMVPRSHISRVSLYLSGPEHTALKWYKFYRYYKSRTREEVNVVDQITETEEIAPKPKRVIPDDPYYKYQWALKTLNAEEAWGISTGKDVLVAVLDTGVDYYHSELDSQIWRNPGEIDGDGIDNDGNGYVDDYMGWDFAGKNWYEYRIDNDVIDRNGHGTHVAGIIAAESDGEGIVGLAPEAKILPVKVLDDAGRGTWNSVADGIKYAAEMGAEVINLSLGGWGWASPYSYLAKAVNYAVSKGCVIVAAAGNSNYNADLFLPANMDDVIAVAATANSNDGRAHFSNYGSVIDVAAPGINILSLRASGTGHSTGYDFYPKYDQEAKHRYLHGTSMATPFVSALAALLIADDPTLTREEVRERIRYSAEDAGAGGFDGHFGYGRIDAFRALTYEKDEYEDYDYSGKAYYESLSPGSVSIIYEGEGIEDEAEAEPSHTIKGVDPNEVIAIQSVQHQNLSEFTGTSPKAGIIDINQL